MSETAANTHPLSLAFYGDSKVRQELEPEIPAGYNTPDSRLHKHDPKKRVDLHNKKYTKIVKSYMQYDEQTSSNDILFEGGDSDTPIKKPLSANLFFA